MRLALSNLAIPAGTRLSALQGLGLQGLEVAPTRIAPWESLTLPAVQAYRVEASDSGLAIPSLQSLLFGTAGLQLLADEASFTAMAEHLRRVSEIGAALGAQIGVFGAPGNRLRGAMPEDDAWALGRERLGVLARIAAESGFAVGLEPVPPFYGGDFLTRATDVIRMVAEVDHPGLRVHLDTGCVMLAGDSIAAAVAEAGPSLGHFHSAEPNLGPFDAPQAEHAAAASALRKAGYAGWVSIEMREQPDAPLAAIRAAVAYARAIYGDGAPG